jgi:protein gp37
MGLTTGIEWTDATWTPIRGRVKDNAAEIAEQKGYSSLIQIAEKMAGHYGPHCEHVTDGCGNCYAESGNARCRTYNGTGLPFDRRSRELLDIIVDEKQLLNPLHWKRPRMIFVCSQTDLFGEWVTNGQIMTVFRTMGLCTRHTFQVLTKRPERARELLSERRWRFTGDAYLPLIPGEHRDVDLAFLPNVWIGASPHNQATARRMMPELLATPAAMRFASYEPALGALDLTPWLTGAPRLDWVIAGGESGPNARPSHPQWFRDVRDQCLKAQVPFFFKQWGEYGPQSDDKHAHVNVRSGVAMDQPAPMFKVGRKKAGRHLEGVSWSQFPGTRHVRL